MLDIFKVFSNESKSSKSVAKERLKLVLVHDRVDCSPQLLDLIKDDILKVIANYAEIEENGLEIKMSKSRGNVVNPDDIVASHGADSLRLYEMFMGPLEASLPWSTNGLDGSRKWLDRVYRLMIETGKLSDENDHSLDRVYHQTVKKVTDDFEKLGFNTAISQMMIFINECYKAEHVYKEYAENFIKMLSCIAPHICEEMWQQLGHNDSIAYEPWPTYDEKMLVSDTVQMGIQVNGKLRAKIEVAKDADDEAVKELAFQQENVKAHTDGKNIVKVIVVKNKIVNIVVK